MNGFAPWMNDAAMQSAPSIRPQIPAVQPQAPAMPSQTAAAPMPGAGNAPTMAGQSGINPQVLAMMRGVGNASQYMRAPEQRQFQQFDPRMLQAMNMQRMGQGGLMGQFNYPGPVMPGAAGAAGGSRRSAIGGWGMPAGGGGGTGYNDAPIGGISYGGDDPYAGGFSFGGYY